MTEREIVRYFVSRDSLDGVLNEKCHLWWQRPIRNSKDGRVAWVAGDHPDPGDLEEQTVGHVTYWFRTYPMTDRELIVVEQYKFEKPAKKKK